MILVFGKSGQVARELQKFHGVLSVGRDRVDFANYNQCGEIIHTLLPKLVINAVAFTSVDRAENEEKLANIVNGKAMLSMSKACQEINAPLVHISTDYVFDGTGDQEWKPEDPTCPLNAYGRSKLLGEKFVRQNCLNHAIVRTSWVFSQHGSNFLKSMLTLSKTKQHLSIVSDQIGGPTPASDLASACLTIGKSLITKEKMPGTYHFCGKPSVSWYDFAKEIFYHANKNIYLEPVLSKEYPVKAVRPLNSRLDCSNTFTTFVIPPSDWQAELKKIIGNLESDINGS